MLDEIHENIVRSYIRAKDENRPHLMTRAFSDSATLEMVVNTDTITFPSTAIGLDAITDVLVRNFSKTYENVYTYCLTDSIIDTKDELSCCWLVGMNERDSGNVRVGYGRYNWQFNNGKKTRADRLIITIEQMVVLPADVTGQIMDWLIKLPYPFCDTTRILSTLPDIDLLTSVSRCIR